MKLLIDVNLSPKWVDVLSEVGWEAVHWASIGSGNSPDTSIMAFATSNGFAILTNDLDFGNILAATNAALPRVIQIRVEDVRPHIAGNFVISVLRDSADDLNRGSRHTSDGSVSCGPLAPTSLSGAFRPTTAYR